MTPLRLALCLLALLSSSASAQADVHVVDSAGVAIPTARVELWKRASLIALRQANFDGLAAFTATEMAQATDLLVRSIGYNPRRVALANAEGRISVRLERLRQSLPAVTIAAAAQTCPQQDQPNARALWQRVAARYREPSLQGRRTELEQRQGTVAEADVGAFYESELRTGSRGYTSSGVRGALQHIADSGYVYPLDEMHSFELFGGWRYAAIDAELAGHFASPGFADAHTFALSASANTVTTLRFCARDRRRNGLDGTLQLSESEGFVEARWRFWNPRTDAEQAGGAATFASARAPEQSAGAASSSAQDSVANVSAPLTSTSGLFWRKLPSGRFVQRWQRFHEWHFIEQHVDGASAERPISLCQPPENYVLCSAVSVSGGGGSVLSSCNSMPYRCFDD